jgi:DICT domain-containing protein
VSLPPAARRSYYSGSLAAFCVADRDEIFARMARQNDFDLTGTQREAWLEQATILARVRRKGGMPGLPNARSSTEQ